MSFASWVFLLSTVSGWYDLFAQNSTTHMSLKHRKLVSGTVNFGKPDGICLANFKQRQSKKRILHRLQSMFSQQSWLDRKHCKADMWIFSLSIMH
jgi:hypothetical protein